MQFGSKDSGEIVVVVSRGPVSSSPDRLARSVFGIRVEFVGSAVGITTGTSLRLRLVVAPDESYTARRRAIRPPPPTGVHENNRIVREAGGNARRRPESTGHRRSGPTGRKRVDLRCRRDGIPSSLPAALPWPRDPDSCASPRPRKTGRRPPRPTLSAQPADTRVAHSDPTPTVASRVRPGECVSSRARVFPAAPGARTSLPRRR